MKTYKAEVIKNGEFYTIRIRGLGVMKTRFKDQIEKKARELIIFADGDKVPFQVDLVEVDR